MVYDFLKLLDAKVKNKPEPIKDSDIGDFKAVLSFQNKKVAIFTKGDDKDHCNRAIRDYYKDNIDVLIMAHRPSCGKINTAQHEKYIVEKRSASSVFEELSVNISDCLKIIIQYTQHCLTNSS